jgi:isopentenyldiphosphate isomerase
VPTHIETKPKPKRKTGYVVAPDGTKKLWVARRSRTKQTWPGKLDHIVAGGQVIARVF